MADRTEIVIHPVSPQGGRKLTVHALGVDAGLGLAFGARGTSEFLRWPGPEDVELSEDGPIRCAGGCWGPCRSPELSP